MDQIALLREMRDSLVAALSKNREVEEIGGFTFLRHAEDKLVWVNQTIPTGSCSSRDLQDLLSRYKATDREPFFEFSPQLSPDVPALLASAGLSLRQEMPVMVLAREEWQPRDYQQQARAARREDLLPGVRAMDEAFGHTGEGPDPTERMSKGVQEGRLLVAVGFVGEQIVAMGQAIGTSRVREVAGIGTLSAYRRRGFGGAVISCLLDQFFSAQGRVAWLTPGDDGAESLYANLGFRTVGTQVCYGLAPAS